jgi:5-methyltetrahydrofolate--homocysteine methyltransferase
MDLKPIYENVIEGQAGGVESGVKAALAAGVNAGKILNEGLIAAMDEVGRRFEDGDFIVPEMLISARAMQAGLALLKPHLASTDIKSAGKVVIGTVKGDLHDIGKNLVAMMLEGEASRSWTWAWMSPPSLCRCCGRRRQLIGMSALLTTDGNMAGTIEAPRQRAARQVKVMVGGATVTESCQIHRRGCSPRMLQRHPRCTAIGFGSQRCCPSGHCGMSKDFFYSAIPLRGQACRLCSMT